MPELLESCDGLLEQRHGFRIGTLGHHRQTLHEPGETQTPGAGQTRCSLLRVGTRFLVAAQVHLGLCQKGQDKARAMRVSPVVGQVTGAFEHSQAILEQAAAGQDLAHAEEGHKH